MPENSGRRTGAGRQFEDLTSDSGGTPRRPDFIQKRREEEWDLPSWERPARRTSLPEEEADVRRQPIREEIPRRRTDRGRGRRRALTALVILVMAGVTALVAIFLVFKIGRIEVTGDPVPGVSDQEIIDAAGYEIGENLIFLSTGEAEERLPREIPAIGAVKIRRRLPTTLEIRVTAAAASTAVAGPNAWLITDGERKILKTAADPEAGALKVLGTSPAETAPGQVLTLNDPDAQAALETVMAALGPALEESQLPGNFTLLDLANLSAIALYYEDRVRLDLGSALELDYKIKAGCRFLADPSAGERGVMDLTATPDTKRAIFTEETVELPALPQYAGAGGQASTPTPEPTPAPDPNATPDPRREGIPQTAYNGDPTPTPESPAGGDGGSDTQDWTDPGETWEDSGEQGTDSQDDWLYEGESWEEDSESWEDPGQEESSEEDGVIDWG